MKKVLCLFLSVLLIALSIPFTASAVYSGKCGSNLTWVLDDAGTLTISGEGEADNKDATQIKRYFNTLSSVFDSLA